MVGRLVDALRDIGELPNTYIVFTSDNGIYLGEHRLMDKGAAYNASPRIPLLVRGPGVPQGATRSQMVLNNDLAPTFADLGGVQVPSFVDGRSLKPLLTTSSPASWRTAFLIEHRRSVEEHSYVRAVPNYDAVRTAQYNYVEYETGEKELYDLNADPYELTNIYASASPTLLNDLKARLDALKSCAGAECKRAKDGG
jgi:arylsulfatase A-like enzyme